MKLSQFSILLFLILSLVSCSPAAIDITLPEYSETLTNSPDVKPAAQAYLEAWKNRNYPAMYRSLTSVSQSAISETEFTSHYQSIADEMLLTDIGWEFLSVLVNETKAQVLYRVTLISGLVNSVTRDTGMTLSLENGEWRVQWDDTMVLPELNGENYLYMEQEGYTPTRANIYDRYAHALVAQTDAVAVGLYPDQINPEQEDQLLTELETLTGLSKERIRSLYANIPQGSGWYIPVSEVPAERMSEYAEALSGFSGLVLEPYRARFYFDNGVAPHVIGYTGMISEDEFAVLRQTGYKADERLGKSGLEKWGESYLSGKRGGELYVYNGQGQPVTRLAEAPASPGEAIYTTLDRDFQLAAQQAISGFRGAVVVLEKDTGRVVAMVSSPGFDPNAFEPSNFNSESLQNLLNDTSQPLLNRATQGLYPLGSVFKTIVMAAGLESGRYTPETTYNCGYIFEELGSDSPLYDWTYQFFLQDGKTKPSGTLSLSQGLVRSCNPWFYHIGLDLFENGLKSFLPDLAAEFGLGRRTGINGVDEESGFVPEPRTEYDATNLGIGQGDLLVTPLQVANFVAALGNGGTLYRPQIVEAVISPNGDPTFMFSPEPVGKLPVKPETLKAIQEAMVGVVRSTHPVGTAWHQFTGLDINVAGKTGTATSGSGAPHAWFAGYTFEDRPDRPDIAVAVVLENAGEGSAYAAPVFRRIIELYFSGQPQKLYEWESWFGVNRNPTRNPDGFLFMKGLVIRTQSGFYTIWTESGNLTCQLRGKLKQVRQSGDVIAVGDWVEFSRVSDTIGMIEQILPRKRLISRMSPQPKGAYEQILIANPDQIVLVFSFADPAPRLGMLDRFLVIAEKSGVPPVIVVNKHDLKNMDVLQDTFKPYQDLSYPVLFTCTKNGYGVEKLHQALIGNISLFTGPSGVGKSSLLNAIQPGLGLAVKEISRSTSKGRHTTVVRELFPLDAGGWVADTPGLKALALWDIEPEELDGYFPEFRLLVAACQFSNCTHQHEPGCAILQAVQDGSIHPLRYESYLRMRFGE